MKKFLSRFGIDYKAIKFIIVGVINTLFGSGLMFLMYNFTNVGYYVSSFSNYFFGSIMSYFLNKYFTFNYKKKSWKTIVNFILNITFCYLLAYGLAKNIITLILKGYSLKFIDNISMLFGMGMFVILNYYGQRYFVFKNNEDL